MKKIFTLLTTVLIGNAIAANAENVVVSVQDWEYNDIAQSFDSELTKNSDGIWTLEAFFNSGYPASFKFEEPAVESYSTIEMAGFLDTSDTFPYLMTSATEYMTCYAYDLDGGENDYTTIYWPYVYTGEKYSWVYRYDETEEYEYFGQILVTGTAEDGGYADYYYLTFFFNDPDKSSSGVADINVSDDAPVEFYNLSGMRVAEPSNGIFIRKQGAEVKKVVIK